MELKRSAYLAFFISNLGEISDNEKRFIDLEIHYQHTNEFRRSRLLHFLRRCRNEKKEFEPILLTMRNKDEDLDDIHKYSKIIFEHRKEDQETSYNYWCWYAPQ